MSAVVDREPTVFEGTREQLCRLKVAQLRREEGLRVKLPSRQSLHHYRKSKRCWADEP